MKGDLIRVIGGGSSSSSSSAKFYEGDAIEARFGGRDKWFKGKITSVNRDGTYDIRYDDGDREKDVKTDLIRPLGGSSSSSSSTKYYEGDVVEARFGGRDKWFKGKITAANRDGTYDIHFDDGDREKDVKADLIRPLGGCLLYTSPSPRD